MTSDPTARVQVYLSSPQLAASLSREAKAAGVSVSQAAARAIARGLNRSLSADPEDRLLKLERSLRDHMQATARDMIILQEVLVEIARALFLRMPDSWCDENPAVQAAVDRRLDLMLDAAAARIARARSASQVEAESRRTHPGFENHQPLGSFAPVDDAAGHGAWGEHEAGPGTATNSGGGDREDMAERLWTTTSARRSPQPPHARPLPERGS